MAARVRLGPAALLAVALFAVYVAGAAPTIYVGDSGELATAVYVLGIPHPTGYPLYVLLGKLWTELVPLGSIAYRMSLFSAACGALACALVYRVGRQLDLPPPAALFSALVLAFAPSFWGEANVQRVYTLNALFVALATARRAVRWDAARDAALVRGHAVSPVGSAPPITRSWRCMPLRSASPRPCASRRWRAATASAPPWVRSAWCGRGAVAAPRVAADAGALGLSAAAFALGLFPYLYLPLRSRADPPLDWGDPQTLERFLAVVLRRDFWDRAWLEGPADLLADRRDYLASLARSSPGRAPRWRALGAAGRAAASAGRGCSSRWSCSATSRRWRRMDRAAICSSGTATTSRPT